METMLAARQLTSVLHASFRSRFASLCPQLCLGDVTLRDGLQGLDKMVPTAQKLRALQVLAESGLYDYLEIGSLVSKTRVPQMADTEELWATLLPDPSIDYGILAIGEANLERAIYQVQPDVVAQVTSLSEAFCQANMRTSAEKSLVQVTNAQKQIHSMGMLSRLYLSCVTDCPMTGEDLTAKVGPWVATLSGFDQLMLSDTTGTMTPDRMRAMIEDLQKYRVDLSRIGLHLHVNDLEVIRVALEHGITRLDTVFGEAGGCVAVANPHYNLRLETLFPLIGVPEDWERIQGLQGMLV